MFSRPSLSALITRVRSDLLARLSTADILRRADYEVYARVLAGIAHGLYGFLGWVADQLFPDTAESEYLDRWGSIWGVSRKPAAVATGSAIFTIQTGAVIPSGTLLQALDGVQYQTTSAATVSGATATAPVSAVVAAAAGNREAGQTLTLVSPIAGVQPAALASALSGGADIETDDALRARLLTRIRQLPQGGSAADFVTWALEVPGVTRAWCTAGETGPGSVTVRFVRDDDASLIPDAGEVATVQAYIDLRRPVTAALAVAAPVAVPIDFTVHAVPDTTDVRAAIAAELADLLLREASPGGTLLLTHIRAAISAATGEIDHGLTVPSANIVSAVGNLSTMGAITWV
jgi:uncharacterized phage protein gp47/JayE